MMPAAAPARISITYTCLACGRELQREHDVLAGDYPEVPSPPPGWHYLRMAGEVPEQVSRIEQVEMGLICERHEVEVRADGQVVWSAGRPEPIGT